MIVDCPCPDHIHSVSISNTFGLSIEIIEHFDVVTNKPDRNNHDITNPVCSQTQQHLSNVRLQPRRPWITTPALIDDRPTGTLDLFGDQTRAFVNLLNVGLGPRHPEWHAMGRKQQRCAISSFKWKLCKCLLRQIYLCFDK